MRWRFFEQWYPVRQSWGLFGILARFSMIFVSRVFVNSFVWGLKSVGFFWRRSFNNCQPAKLWRIYFLREFWSVEFIWVNGFFVSRVAWIAARWREVLVLLGRLIVILPFLEV